MGRALTLVVAMLASCVPVEELGVIVLTAAPRTIEPNGQTARVTAAVTRQNGEVGKGAVRFVASAGSLSAGSTVQLDSFGSAVVEVACDQASDPKCADGMSVTATWGAVAESVSIKLSAGGAGGGTAGADAGMSGAPCADGTRDGLDQTRHPNVAACSGTFSGWIDEPSAAALCGVGWRVCTGLSSALGAITTTEATTTPGCFAFDAANDCGVCFPSCRGSLGTTRMGCTVPADPNGPNNPDLAAVGAACPTKLAEGSCLRGSLTRVDAATNMTGCAFNSRITGVLCCRQ